MPIIHIGIVISTLVVCQTYISRAAVVGNYRRNSRGCRPIGYINRNIILFIIVTAHSYSASTWVKPSPITRVITITKIIRVITRIILVYSHNHLRFTSISSCSTAHLAQYTRLRQRLSYCILHSP